MSQLQPWLQSHGFIENPFGHYTADNTPSEMLQATYIYDSTLANLMLSNQSVALLAPYGGGKTMARRYWQTQWQKKHSDTLIVIYNDFSYPAQNLPVASLATHIRPLLGSLAETIWQSFTAAQERLLSLTDSDQLWWWAFLEDYYPDRPFYPFQLANYPDLKESYRRLFVSNKTNPFSQQHSLDRRLNQALAYLNRAGFSRLLILVDEVDAQAENQPDSVEKIIFPLLNTLRLFSNEQIIWKFFLPDSIARSVGTSSAVSRLRVETETIRWEKDQLKALLQNRLAWASSDAVNSLEKLKLGEGMAQLDGAETSKLDDEFITLVTENRSPHGAPRTLLLYGRTLFATLGTRGDELITQEGWQAFLDLIHKQTQNYALVAATAREQLEPMTRPELQQILIGHFNLDELRTLSLNLNINYENIPGDALNAKARELVLYCDRDGRLDDLKEKISQARPNLFVMNEDLN